MTFVCTARPDVVTALRMAGIDNPEVFLYPTYLPCECGWCPEDPRRFRAAAPSEGGES